MKLFARYSRINVLANIVIFLVASIAFYFSLRYVLIKVVDDDLEIEEDEICAYVKEHNRLPESFSVSDQVIYFTPVPAETTRNWTTVKMIASDDNKEENFRRLTFSVPAEGRIYLATVSKSLEGTNNLLRSILTVSVSTILAILLVSFVINRVLLKKLWRPFYQSLSTVENFSISKDEALQLPVSDIDEFAFMNEALEGLTKKSRIEYLSLKTFSENASHEIQTPLAIIRSKLDLLIQDECLTKTQGQALQSAYNAVEKLSRLNQSLLLLAKIENHQFQEMMRVDLEEKLREKCNDFKELWDAQAMAVNTSFEKVFVKMNPELADILLNNLLSNATRHNYKGGSILLSLSESELTIANTGEAPLDSQQLFQRFYKPSTGNSHNGLGLSIIKQICEVSGFELRYQHQQSQHSFAVSWERL